MCVETLFKVLKLDFLQNREDPEVTVKKLYRAIKSFLLFVFNAVLLLENMSWGLIFGTFWVFDRMLSTQKKV